MSNNTELKSTGNSNEWIDWIEEAISKKYFKYYEYEHFSNIQEIGTGGFGKVYRANWKNSPGYLALKSLSNLNDDITVKETVREVIIRYYKIIYSVFLLYIFNLKLHLLLA